LALGQYFLLMMIAFFEGIAGERGIAWWVADSLTLHHFLQTGLDERTPDHVTISRTRRLIDEATHQEVFGWVLTRLARGGLVKGETIGIDSTTLEAKAPMKSIVRRDTQTREERVERNFAHQFDSGAWTSCMWGAATTRTRNC
jgi:transposase